MQTFKLYDYLNLDKNASSKDIKKMYRKLAKTHHPDMGGDSEEFQKIQIAYEILSDGEKRNQYDQIGDSFLEHQNNSSQNPFNMHMDDMGMPNIFNMFFRNNQKNNEKTMSSYQKTLNITLDKVYTGLLYKYNHVINKICTACRIVCTECNGKGVQQFVHQIGPFQQIIQQPCSSCEGKKFKQKNQCDICTDGKISTSTILDININRGIEQNKTFMFPKLGEQPIEPNDIAGDLIIIINIKDKYILSEKQNDIDFISRRNNDIIVNITLTWKESLIGKELLINLFDLDPPNETIIKFNTCSYGIINPMNEYLLKNSVGFADNSHIYFKFKIMKYPSQISQKQKETINLLFS
jgi:DnaJ-class molecular chaperone